jgi:Homing endonuclease associated repeat
MRTVDQDALRNFRRGLRRRYSDDDIVRTLRASAERLGRSPTMREFADDPHAPMHPQTVIEWFGMWNGAKRRAGLRARRFATRDELLDQLRALGDELGRVPTGRDLDERRGTVPSKSLYWHTFGSLTEALRTAGFDVPVGEERLARALEQGAAVARQLGRLPRFTDWAAARREDADLLTEWQVYRLFAGQAGAWSTFQFLVRDRLTEEGVDVGADGALHA